MALFELHQEAGVILLPSFLGVQKAATMNAPPEPPKGGVSRLVGRVID